MKNLPKFVLAIGLVLATTSACGGESSDSPDNTLTVTLTSEPTTLDPQLRGDNNERIVNYNIYETLVRRSADGKELMPLLAESMPELTDELTWTIPIRKGVEFQNGEKLDADAVVFSIKRMLDPKYDTQLRSFVETISEVTADGDNVRIVTSKPDPVLVAKLARVRIVAPKHAADAKFADEPVGTGPYELVKWNKGRDIIVERNDSYWGDKPEVARATFRFAENAGTRLSQLRSGETDVIPAISPEDLETVPQAAEVKDAGSSFLILNTRDGIASDVRVREALNLAIDKTKISEDLFLGHAKPNSHPYSTVLLGSDPSLAPYPYDLGRAKSLIVQAGAAGKSIGLVGAADRFLKGREEMETVAAAWEEIGLKVDLQLLEIGDYVDQLLDPKSQPDAIHVVHANEMFDPDQTMRLYYDAKGLGAANDDAELSKIVNAAGSEVDNGERGALYGEALTLAHDKFYFAFIHSVNNLYGLSDRVEWKPRADELIMLDEFRMAD